MRPNVESIPTADLRMPTRALQARHNYLIRDRHASYGHAVTGRLSAMGHPRFPAASPWQRWVGSIRRDCLDYIVVFSEVRLRRILATYTG
jgi:hypothetical protein